MRDDIGEPRDGQHIAVYTPGRVFDMSSKCLLPIDDLITFAYDEADDMLSRDFNDQINDISKTMSPNVQVCLFSALALESLPLTAKFMRDAVRIDVKRHELTLEGICLLYVSVEKEERKLDTPCDFYETFTITQIILYSRNAVLQEGVALVIGYAGTQR